jgi:hypothetical protein
LSNVRDGEAVTVGLSWLGGPGIELVPFRGPVGIGVDW